MNSLEIEILRIFPKINQKRLYCGPFNTPNENTLHYMYSRGLFSSYKQWDVYVATDTIVVFDSQRFKLFQVDAGFKFKLINGIDPNVQSLLWGKYRKFNREIDVCCDPIFNKDRLKKYAHNNLYD